MGLHDVYGKNLFKTILGNRFVTNGEATKINYNGFIGNIDGAIDNSCAVEIESRVNKQIRGAVLDLLCHPFPKKLLVIIPVHMGNPSNTIIGCQAILEKLRKPDEITKVILLLGSGFAPKEDSDLEIVIKALREFALI